MTQLEKGPGLHPGIGRLETCIGHYSYKLPNMKTYKTFITELKKLIKYAGSKTHKVIDPVTHKQITVPKGYAVPKGKSSSSGGPADGSDGGNGGGGNGGDGD